MGRLASLLLREGEAQQAYLKKRFFFLSTCIAAVVIGAAAGGSNWSSEVRASNASCISGILVNAVASLCVILSKRAPRWLIQGTLLLNVVPVALMDLHLTSNIDGYRTWPFAIIVLDIALVLQEPEVAYLVIAATSVWICTVGAEQTFRYGLFDLFLSDGAEKVCNCADPPCARDGKDAVSQLAGTVFVLYFNLYLTHGFSKALWKGQREIETAISVAERIAVALAGFDIATASSALEGAEAASLPKPLAEAFHTLVANLQEYRPYLPQSCLPYDEGTEKDDPPMTRSDVSSVRDKGDSDIGLCEFVFSNPLSPKRASLLMTNLHGLLQQSADEISEVQRVLISHTTATVRQHHGVLHHFNGDHILAIFNGAKPCITHAKSAACCSWDLAAGWSSPLHLSVGVATGVTLYGNIGSNDTKGYGIIGDLFGWTAALVRAATKEGIASACDDAVENEIRGQFHTRLLLNPLVYGKNGVVHDVFEITGAAVGRPFGGEWMYEMEERLRGSPWSAYNKAVTLARRGELRAAKELLQEERPDRWETLFRDLDTVTEVQVLYVTKVSFSPLPPSEN